MWTGRVRCEHLRDTRHGGVAFYFRANVVFPALARNKDSVASCSSTGFSETLYGATRLPISRLGTRVAYNPRIGFPEAPF